MDGSGSVVVIPLCGEAKRFRDRGYHHPKYLLTVRGKPMLQWAVESLRLPKARYLFVCREEHFQTYAVEELIHQLVQEAHIVRLGEPTEGAACTVLRGLTLGEVPDATPLWIANCDQWLEWEPTLYGEVAEALHVDGGILLTRRLNPQMSFARVRQGFVTEVAEKRPISPYATCGVYHFTRTQAFREGATRMIQQNRRINGEFYVCPVYNELLAQGAMIAAVSVADFWGLGTPEDWEEFRLWRCRQ